MFVAGVMLVLVCVCVGMDVNVVLFLAASCIMRSFVLGL